jgi:hypothetical protein
MDYYYAKPVKNRKEETCTAMMFLSCLFVAAINIISNIIISVSRVTALLLRATMNSFFMLILINLRLKWK